MLEFCSNSARRPFGSAGPHDDIAEAAGNPEVTPPVDDAEASPLILEVVVPAATAAGTYLDRGTVGRIADHLPSIGSRAVFHPRSALVLPAPCPFCPYGFNDCKDPFEGGNKRRHFIAYHTDLFR